jgi:hypothetical protein
LQLLVARKKACRLITGLLEKRRAGYFTSAGTGLLASSIAIVGNDIYISGFIVENGKQVACYWKNGIKTNLVSTATFSNATGITIHGNDIYMLESQGLTYWKNGTLVQLGQPHPKLPAYF